MGSKKSAPPADYAPTSALQPQMLVAAAAVALTVLYLVFAGKRKGSKFLNKTRQQLVLGEREELSHDTVRLRFNLPKATPVLGLPVGQHFKLFCPNSAGKEPGKWNGRDDPEADATEIERKYTPTTSDDEVGFVDLVVKVYKGGVVDRFPDGGKMSQYLGALKVGDKLAIQGPVGTKEYLGRGKLMHSKKELTFTELGLIAGGSGITPMLQIISAVLKDPKDTTKLFLIYANQTPSDILVRDMLDGLAAKHPTKLSVWYTVDRDAPTDWNYSVGFIDEKMLAEHLPAPSDQSAVLMCGPPPMINFACMPNLDKVGHKKNRLIAF